MRVTCPQTLQVSGWSLDCSSDNTVQATSQKYLLYSSFVGADCNVGIFEDFLVYLTFPARKPAVQIQLLKEAVGNHNYSVAYSHSASDYCGYPSAWNTGH